VNRRPMQLRRQVPGVRPERMIVSSLSNVIMFAVASAVGLWLLSFVLEAVRPTPASPKSLPWAPGVPVHFADLGGYAVRYIRAGDGPILVLLHTLRTQLDLFEKVVPELAKHFTVYALDYPGHGYSDIPPGRYDAGFFVDSVEAFLQALDLRDVTLTGVSIGGATALIVAGRRNPRVSRVVAINPYDYARGNGMARSSFLGWMITMTARVHVLGETVMRLRNFIIMKAVLRGGVSNPLSISEHLLKEMYGVGNRRGHYRAFLQLLRNSPSWEAAREIYGNIRIPVSVIWGDQDWSTPRERESDNKLIPAARVVTVCGGGHFLPLDRPDAVVENLKAFVVPRPTDR
jgi:pimeloyl-ACP methyl ester carboxylesterase